MIFQLIPILPCVIFIIIHPPRRPPELTAINIINPWLRKSYIY